uniref:uncharacterized protein LOC120348372 n=1 Tax=Styela clava TaxID=7725 RepID=UPI00193A592F|nr:uncharacterized protein LOC120348372 [Styela clava]
MQKLFLFFLIVAAIWHQGLALTCYECLNCNTVSSSDAKVCPDTSGLTTMCIKVEGNVLGIGTTSRSCGYGTSETCSTSTVLGITGTVCYCATDFCNGAETVKISVMIGTLIAGILAKILM